MRLSHWQEMQIDFSCTGKKRQGKGAERNIKTDNAVQYVARHPHHKHTHTHPTLGPFGQLSGEQDVGQLALRVGPDRVVVFLAAQVVELDLARVVSHRRQVDDPGRGRVLQQVQKQKGQEEVT